MRFLALILLKVAGLLSLYFLADRGLLQGSPSFARAMSAMKS